MEKLWSPWRSHYIESFKSKNEDDKSCIFCAAVDADVVSDDNLKVFEGKKVFIILNLYPYNNGHLMVVPKRHVADYIELTSEELAEVNDLIKLTITAQRKIMKPHGFNIGANLGKAAGAGIDEHIHFHVLPRWNGDTNFMPALGEVKVISQDLKRSKNELVKMFNLLLDKNI
ncbi:MAG: HIT domain-containing protein [Ignavibacteriae bacterium]|nr:HIT domain-containing protein [Ignavibacteriota bacterium]NOG98759.1 HIT domain-containing protein [Ignavibacteriota bacterium]